MIRGGEVLERAEKLTAVIFDKTGTLTLGEPNVTDLLPFGAHTETETLTETLRMAAAVEVGSEHPLGEAIVRAAKHRSLELSKVTQFESIPGHGIRGVIDGRTVLLGNRRLFKCEGVDPAPAEEATTPYG